MIFEPGPTIEQFLGVFPLSALREIARTIVAACPPVVQRCTGKYPTKMLPQVIGTEIYFDVHAALLNLKALNDIVPILSITSERHEGGNTYYTAIRTPDARIVANKTDSSLATPAPHQVSQALPTSPTLWDQNEKQIAASIAYGFGSNRAIVSYMNLLLVHPKGFYVPDQRLDLLALLKADTTGAPIEPIGGTTVTPLRKGKEIQRERKPKHG